jgi:hypothetical protein
MVKTRPPLSRNPPDSVVDRRKATAYSQLFAGVRPSGIRDHAKQESLNGFCR